MSASQSNISIAPYGYDFVIGVPQGSINAQMKTFLSAGTMPEVKICYIADPNGNPTQISYDDLLAKANGSDPFTVPAGADPSTDKDLLNLLGARFMVGFDAQIGLPPGYQPSDIPDVVTLGTDTSIVTFTLMCSTFVVVQLSPGSGYAPASWFTASQPDGDAWLFTSKVNLRMFPTPQSEYDSLPPAVQTGIQKLSGQQFSVQQLLFDLDNAALETVPTISGVQPGTTLYTVLQTYFLGAYFRAMQQNGSPVLGCTIGMGDAQSSSLDLTNVQMEVVPFLGPNGLPLPNPTPQQQSLSTLNYLCTVDNDQPVPPAQFTWNWLDSPGASSGVIAINRDTLATYFERQVVSYVQNVCYAPSVRVWLDDWGTDINFWWNMTPYQSPTVTMPTSGSTVAQFQYSSYAHDQAGLNGDMGQMTLQPSFTGSVEFSGNTIVVTQHFVVYLYVKVMATGAGSNAIDKTITDTYTLTVDDTGKLGATVSSKAVDNSDPPSVGGFLNFWTGLNAISDSVAYWINSFTATNLTDLPLSVPQSFVFPAGETFSFATPQFSDFQDLTAGVTYADPTAVHLSTLPAGIVAKASMLADRGMAK